MKKLLLSILISVSIGLNAQWQSTSIFSTGYDCITAFGKVYSSGGFSNALDVTSNEGATWASANSGLPSGGLYFGVADASKLYACRGNSISVTSSANNWTAMSHTLTGGYNVKSMAIIGTSVIAAVNYIYSPLSCRTYIYNGSTWAQYGTSYPNRQFSCIRNLNGTVFAGTSANLVMKSPDAGITFTASSTGMPNANSFDKYVNCLAATSTAIFAGTQNGNICRSMDNGATWTTVYSIAGSSSIDISDIYVTSTNKILVACDSGFVYSSDNGNTWGKNNSGLSYVGTVFYDPLSKITTSTNYIFAATKNGKIYRRPITEIFSGIKENTISQVASKVYPNPASANFTIESDDLMFDNNCSITLSDVLGREVVSREMKSGKVEMNAAEFSEGIYSYIIYSNKQTVGKGKLIITP